RKVLLEAKHDIEEIDRLRPQIPHQRRFGSDLVVVDAERINQCFTYFGKNLVSRWHQWFSSGGARRNSAPGPENCIPLVAQPVAWNARTRRGDGPPTPDLSCLVTTTGLARSPLRCEPAPAVKIHPARALHRSARPVR